MTFPKRLFKYTSAFGIDCVRKLRIRVTPPNEFNDALELAAYVKPVGKDHITNLIQTTHSREIYDAMRAAGEEVGTYEEFCASLERVAPALVEYGGDSFQEQYEGIIKKHIDGFSETSGVLCLSENENNHLMWAHYADSHKGMLLEFDCSHIYFNLYSRFLKVCYSSERVYFDPNQDSPAHFEDFSLNVVRTKYISWSYESEWRGAYPLGHCEKVITDKGETLYFTHIPPDLITRIVLGEKFPLEKEKTLVDVIASNGLKIKLQRAKRHKTEFTLEYHDI